MRGRRRAPAGPGAADGAPPPVVRLVVVVGAAYWGGAERFLQYLVSGLSSDVVVTVVGPQADIVSRVAAARPGARAVVVPMEVRAVRRALRELAPDVVHVNLPSFTSCRPAVVAALLLRLPTVLVDHLPVPGLTWKGRALQRATSRAAAARVGVGERASRLVEAYCGLPVGSVRTIRNGVPPPAASRREPMGDPVVLGVLGALDERKGVDVLLAALPEVPDVRVRVAGAGPERDALESVATELGVSSRVDFTGVTADAAEFYRSVDVVVLPSRAEALPLVVLEAMHVGLPVVATDVGSVAEVVVDGVTGRVVPPDDPRALAAALREVTSDPAGARALGEAAARQAQAELTDALMAARYEALYREAAQLRPRRRRPALD